MQFGQLKRREFLTLLGGAAASVSTPLPLCAQEAGRIYRIGFVSAAPREEAFYVAFFEELRGLGFVEGQNLSVIPGGFGIRNELLGEVAAALARAPPDAIIAAGPIATRAAQAATKTIPILAASDDMVEDGLVTSMRRPGGNTTGVSLLAPELDGKRQDLIMEAVPGIRRIAALSDPHVSTPQHLQDMKEVARAHNVELLVFSATTPEGIVPAMNEASVASVQALNVLATPLFFFNRQTVLARATELRLPAIYQWPEMAEQGGLAGYGPRITQWFRQLARLLVQVLRGANPGELPVEQPTRFELVLNLQAAKAIGHEIPAGLVLRADKVIE
jgi:putative tryptophan/tyrosine transport system substrate-binding protein